MEKAHLSVCFLFSDNTVVLPCFSPVHATLKSAFSSLVAERDRLRHTIDLQAPQPGQVMGLKTAYASVSVSMTQQSLFRMITPQIPPHHHRSNSTKTTSYAHQECPGVSHSLVHQASNDSKASIPESISEFFDAQEYLLSSSSSENEVRDYKLPS